MVAGEKAAGEVVSAGVKETGATIREGQKQQTNRMRMLLQNPNQLARVTKSLEVLSAIGHDRMAYAPQVLDAMDRPILYLAWRQKGGAVCRAEISKLDIHMLIAVYEKMKYEQYLMQYGEPHRRWRTLVKGWDMGTWKGWTDQMTKDREYSIMEQAFRESVRESQHQRSMEKTGFVIEMFKDLIPGI